ncbi:MAG: hypothetical protein COB12_06355 [Flavobacterium sp.]|nr:MAG: hypothetical protein COB12_06355 [Flavobacterium sp.]
MKQLIITLVFFTFFISKNAFAQSKTIEFPAEDGVTITADLYLIEDAKAPFIILFHQAGYSRGEYLEIAPKLNKLGFNCMAIDQRSGKGVNGIKNETNKSATALNKKTKYPDAIPDVEAAFNYVKNELKASKIIIWGSSYSAALVLYLGSQHPNEIAGILSFSPGEYFKIDGKEIKSYTSKIICPVFITSAKNEHDSWKGMYDMITSEKSYFLPKVKGKHGSKALWENSKENEDYWRAVTEFLKKI